MHKGEQSPIVQLDTTMKEVIYEMSRKGFGITSVVNDGGKLEGVISDGDLRRLIEKDSQLLTRTARECMKSGPATIEPTELASAALQKMEEKKITSLFVTDETTRVLGIVHLHDLWG